MHISKIYIQDNFVPDWYTDPFRRKVIGFEVTIQEHEKNVDDAIADAEKRIEEYVKANTAQRLEGEKIIQSDRPKDTKEAQLQGYLEAINSCSTLKVLGIYEKLVKRENNPLLTEAYDNKLKTFQ